MVRLTSSTLLADTKVISMSRVNYVTIHFFRKLSIFYLYIIYSSTLETEKMIMWFNVGIVDNLVFFYSKLLNNTKGGKKRHVIIYSCYGEGWVFFLEYLVDVLSRIVAPVITEKPEKHQPRCGKRNMVLLEYFYFFLNLYFINTLHDNIIRQNTGKSKNQKLIYFKNNYEFQ